MFLIKSCQSFPLKLLSPVCKEGKHKDRDYLNLTNEILTRGTNVHFIRWGLFGEQLQVISKTQLKTWQIHARFKE